MHFTSNEHTKKCRYIKTKSRTANRAPTLPVVFSEGCSKNIANPAVCDRKLSSESMLIKQKTNVEIIPWEGWWHSAKPNKWSQVSTGHVYVFLCCYLYPKPQNIPMNGWLVLNILSADTHSGTFTKQSAWTDSCITSKTTAVQPPGACVIPSFRYHRLCHVLLREWTKLFSGHRRRGSNTCGHHRRLHTSIGKVFVVSASF